MLIFLRSYGIHPSAEPPLSCQTLSTSNQDLAITSYLVAADSLSDSLCLSCGC